MDRDLVEVENSVDEEGVVTASIVIVGQDDVVAVVYNAADWPGVPERMAAVFESVLLGGAA